MENETNQNTPESQQPVAPVATPATEGAKKTSPWVWVISGCLVIVVLTMGAIGFLGYWGYHKAKNEIQKQQPGLEQFKENLEKAGVEAEELNKKAQEIQEAIPTPEDLNYTMPAPE